MKPTSLLLTGSLIANVALLTAYAFTSDDSVAGSEVKTGADAPVAKASTSSTTASGAAVKAAAAPSGVAADKRWARLATEDISSLVARLRAAGFPPSLVRVIVNQRFELRREELTLDGNDRPYWKNETAPKVDAKTTAELEKLEREREETMVRLFGSNEDSDFTTDEALVMQRRRFGSLTAETVSKINAIQQGFGKELQQIYSDGRPAPTPADIEKIAALLQRQHAEIAKALTPGELLEYDYRNSMTANRLRSDLTGLNSTEAEYRGLFALYQAFEAKFPASAAQSTTSMKPEDFQARATAQEQMQAQIKTMLGPERYAEYQQASVPEYRPLNNLVLRLDLPLSAAAQVVAVQRDVEARAAAVRGDAGLSADERAAKLGALATEANQKISGAIGARGLEGYKQYGGQWMKALGGR